MKHSQPRIRRHREAGVALLTVLMISMATAMILGASLCVSMTSSKLGWSQARAESALQLADAGVNSELQYIAQNTGQTLISLRSSQPVAGVGVTIQYPGENFPIKGRNGTVPGFSGGQFWVYSSNDAAGTVPWDGVTSPFYITASGYINNAWQRVQVSTQSGSLFNLYGTVALGSYTGDNTGVTVAGGSNVVVTGPAGINGTVTTGSGGSITAPQAINANTCTNSTGQSLRATLLLAAPWLSNQLRTSIRLVRRLSSKLAVIPNTATTKHGAGDRLTTAIRAVFTPTPVQQTIRRSSHRTARDFRVAAVLFFRTLVGLTQIQNQVRTTQMATTGGGGGKIRPRQFIP